MSAVIKRYLFSIELIIFTHILKILKLQGQKIIFSPLKYKMLYTRFFPIGQNIMSHTISFNFSLFLN